MDGWSFSRQRGSHMMLTKPGVAFTLTIPDHSELAPGTLRSIIRMSGMTVAQFETLRKI